MPMIEGDLTGHDGRSALMAIVDDFEQIAALFAAQRSPSPIVENEEFDARQRLEKPGVATIAAGERQCPEQARKAMVENGAVVAAGRTSAGR
jgi:hypothetical protein